jgi:hypothetical protein
MWQWERFDPEGQDRPLERRCIDALLVDRGQSSLSQKHVDSFCKTKPNSEHRTLVTRRPKFWNRNEPQAVP